MQTSCKVLAQTKANKMNGTRRKHTSGDRKPHALAHLSMADQRNMTIVPTTGDSSESSPVQSSRRGCWHDSGSHWSVASASTNVGSSPTCVVLRRTRTDRSRGVALELCALLYLLCLPRVATADKVTKSAEKNATTGDGQENNRKRHESLRGFQARAYCMSTE